ncbi:putative DNA polymerase iota [Aspergillus undulatus]|uniref:putative DNA polymerase iota n=1 Tax=Aspergillus undulatus TaxID=1810928 RepID=UPI003CCCC2E4
MAAAPSRYDHRIIIHFDYDCFYASVFEAEQPILKTLPLAVQQKQIVVTCNYEARRRGLRKLQLIKEAKQVCPDVVIVLGEDLTKFRDASKDLYLFLRGLVWGERVEKLGFDEIFMDVTDMINYNAALLNVHDLENSFFQLDKLDPTVGFEFDATGVYGPTYPEVTGVPSYSMSAAAASDASQLQTRLLVASHFAGYLRGQLEEQKGYTATAGISTSKLLAKVVGGAHKPNSQTTLLPPYAATEAGESNVLNFLDPRKVRAIPGLGSKLSRRITSYIAARNQDMAEEKVTIRDVRLFPDMGPSLLEKILGGPGAPRDIGMRVWGLLHGVDSSQVGEARDTPTQISIENSYGHLDNFDTVRKELVTLAISLIRRMRMDLTESYSDAETTARNASEGTSTFRESRASWLALPRTLRLSTVPRTLPGSDPAQVRGYSRISSSAPLPQYMFNLDESVDALAERLVRESVTSMFRKLHRERSGWNLRVLNLAVTNMAEVAGDGKHNSGRDIGKMFQRQETEHKTSLPDPEPTPPSLGIDVAPSTTVASEASWESDGEENDNMPCVLCSICGASIPQFALVAHKVYHSSKG